MISVIRSELRKYIRRPAPRSAAAFVAVLVALAYGITLYSAINAPGTGPGIQTLYPKEFVNNVMGATGLSSAIVMIVGAVIAGSDYAWGTLKTALTQRAGRFTIVAGRLITFSIFTSVLTLIILLVGAASSLFVAGYERHAVSWPAAIDIVKGFGAIWLVLSSSGMLGVALGTLFRNSAAAVGVGLIYELAIQLALVRFIAGVSGGAYKWLANLFEGQNSSALAQSFTSPAWGPVPKPDVAITTAVLVLFAYVATYVLATATLVRQRDVT